MFKKTMTFDDLEGNEVTQTFYFNYNKKEVAELLEFGQLEAKIKKLSTPTDESGLSDLENNQQAYEIFQDLILGAYGVKGEDNVTFVKNEETRDYLKNHVAFVDMIFEFLENPSLGAQFIENCLPAKMVAKAKEEMAREQKGQVSDATLSQMVQEAQRRQEDPATRIEPGLENAPEHIREHAKELGITDPGATNVNAKNEAKRPQDLTPEDIRNMPQEEFARLDVRQLNQESLIAAFGRKSGG